MKFELTPLQVAKLKEWQNEIKKKHGLYGQYKFSFTPTGIGFVVEAYSLLAETILDLTDEENW